MLLKLRKGLVILLAGLACVFVYVTVSLAIIHHQRHVEFSYEHAGTDLTFASSDGVWRAEEDMMNGRLFEDILVDFELYRVLSGKADAQLLRTKPWKKPWNWAWWFDRRDSPKWKVPYKPLDELPSAPDEMPPLREPSPTELLQARSAAEAFLRRLH